MLRLVRNRLIAQNSSWITLLRSSSTEQSSSNQQSVQVNPNVPGLSNNCVDVPNTPVGAVNASKDTEYKNPEYFCYHVNSFSEAEVEMEKYRLKAPSNKK